MNSALQVRGNLYSTLLSFDLLLLSSLLFSASATRLLSQSTLWGHRLDTNLIRSISTGTTPLVWAEQLQRHMELCWMICGVAKQDVWHRGSSRYMYSESSSNSSVCVCVCVCLLPDYMHVAATYTSFVD